MRTSEQLTKLLPAFASAKKAFGPAIKTAVNPMFNSRYVDLASTFAAAEEALSANGLIVMQGVSGDAANRTVTVTTRLFHVSGEWIESDLTIPAAVRDKYDAQTVGSAATYAKRYGYSALMGLAGEDDDGNATSHGDAPAKAAKPKTVEARSSTPTSEPAVKPNVLNFTITRVQEKESQYGPTLAVEWKDGRAFVNKVDLFDRIKRLRGIPATYKVTHKSGGKGDYIVIDDVIGDGTEITDADVASVGR